LQPQVYRQPFTDQAKKFCSGRDGEASRQHLERCLLNEFRASGTSFLDKSDRVAIYLMAQHYGMPTRLLDWTTNPLAALFFATEIDERQPKQDGEVFMMEATSLISRNDPNHGLWDIIYSVRHPYAMEAVGESFWSPIEDDRPRVILPIQPDNLPGRIGQQNSCFTMHMHLSPSTSNPTLAFVKIHASKKDELRRHLHRVNVNQFTIFYDLDRLSKEIRRCYHV
jgi:hypothetical protein